MAKDSAAFFVVMAGAGINSVNAIQKGESPARTIYAGLAFGTVCVGINTLAEENFGTMLAIVFLLSSFLRNGVRVLDTASNAIDSLGKV